MSSINKILSDINTLSSDEKLQLVDKILTSFHPSNKGVEQEWERESEERIRSYEKGSLPTLNATDVLSKYKK